MRGASVGHSTCPSYAQLSPDFAERFQTPCVLGRAAALTENVEIPVIGADFEEQIAGTIPLIEDLFNAVDAFAQVKAHGTFVCLPSRITINP